jgi:spore coat protein X
MSKVKKWRALDHCDEPSQSNAIEQQEADQVDVMKQTSEEWIIIKDSEEVHVTTTDTQTAVSLQVGIEAALMIVLRLAIASEDQVEDIMQDFNQISRIRQRNRQKTIVEQSKDVNITTTDTDIAINLQLLIQILLGVILSLEIL